MPFAHVGLILFLFFIWGFNFVVISIGLEGIPPLFLAFTRFFLTSLPAVFFVKRPAIPFRMTILYALFMFVLQYSLLFLGMYAGVTSGLASILLQVHVFFSILIGIVWFGERLRKWQIAGALVSLGGIVLIAMNLSGQTTLLGFLLTIAAGLTWSGGTAIAKKIGKVDVLSLVVWGSLIAWPPLLLLSWIVEGPDKILAAVSHLSFSSIGAIAYIAYCSTLLAFLIWNWLVHHHPLSTISPFSLTVPVIGMISSALVLGEPLQTWKIVAAVLVIGGLGINIFGPRLMKMTSR